MGGETKSVEALRDAASKGMLVLLWLHLPLSLAISLARGMDWAMPLLLMAVLAVAATLSWRIGGNGISTRCTVAVALMGGVSLLVYQLSGHPWQIDMHMYFFATLACLAAYCDFRPILIGAAAVALHHLTLNFAYPAAVYPGGSDFARVIVHAVILVFEAAILVWLPYKLSQMFELMAEKNAEAEAAKAAQQKATAERIDAERKARQERDTARRQLADRFEQTAKATEEIAGQIQAIQGATSEAVGASQAIDTTISEINQISSAIASSVEQQGAATRKIAGNIHQASRSAQEVNSNIAGVTAAASEVGNAAGQVMDAATGLSSQSEKLKAEVNGFLDQIRAA